MEENVRLKKTVNQAIWKKLAVFFAFQLVFSAVTMPLLVFYGPFENIKTALVGTSINTFKAQWIARMFLSDEAINRILGNTIVMEDEFENDFEPDAAKIKIPKNLSDKIEIFNIDGGDFKGKLMIVHDSTRVVTGYSSKLPKPGDPKDTVVSGEMTSSIAKRAGAIAAINAGGFMDLEWTGTGGAPTGFIISDGKVIFDQMKDENIKQDTAAFTKEGMLIVGKHSIAQLKKYGVKEAVSFGPPLIVNGKPTIKSGDGGWGIAPRTAIGQRADGAVLMLVIDGRRLGSLGATLRDLQDILLQYKAVNAVNLDGGSSSTMYFNGKVINNPSDVLGERTVPSVFMVMPDKGERK
ncbi:MAG: phosphodiester glycosidase family protein [Clostridia bacterium]|nr:phosphodiester glycosidase family protein [Clostridia bacterium]